MIARSCIPGGDLFTAFMRLVAVALAFASGAVLSLFDSTSNDLMAAIPLLWAYALALRPFDAAAGAHLRYAAASGFLAGISVAFKMSNGFLVLAMPLPWLLAPGALRERAARALLACACLLAGCAVFYGYWGWQLWSHFGNPVYPLYDSRFAMLREWLGWQP